MKKLLPFLLAAILVFPAFTTQKAPAYRQVKMERPAHHYAAPGPRYQYDKLCQYNPGCRLFMQNRAKEVLMAGQ